MHDDLFQTPTPLGFIVRATRSRWERIVAVKHPVMRGREESVAQAIRDPEQIRRSRSDPAVHLFYRREREGRWICAVAKQTDGDGFLITAYPTDTIKVGELLWRK